ncbi:unnamed protein product [Heligmosomoides polygyrus]|uniref:Uncharacterized protein n=1 Tax=Heligmosomoides polygyrus TaxID=6339 RepID=A0A183GCF8_HELPZ|nr:unnamed protein product [Heligmosomoides polygyrus]
MRSTCFKRIPGVAPRELAEELECIYTSIAQPLCDIGATYRFDAWIWHELLDFTAAFSWLEKLVTMYEKWVPYVNHTRKRQWRSRAEEGIPTPRQELHPKM